jgi:hypothetical protein
MVLGIRNDFPLTKAVNVFRATLPERVFGKRLTATNCLKAATGPICCRTVEIIAFATSSDLLNPDRKKSRMVRMNLPAVFFSFI